MQQVFIVFTETMTNMIMIVIGSLMHNWIPLSLAILTAALMKVYSDTEKLKHALLRRPSVSIWASVAVGAFTPLCACGTMAVVLGMLTTTLPWGPIMAFLTSSPLMSPDGFIMVAGMLSLQFAIALTLASIAIGLGSGYVTHLIEQKTDFLNNQTRFAKEPQPQTCGCPDTNSLPQPVQTCGCRAAEAPLLQPVQTRDSSASASMRHGPALLRCPNRGQYQPISLDFSIWPGAHKTYWDKQDLRIVSENKMAGNRRRRNEHRRQTDLAVLCHLCGGWVSH
jgi:uncharacterized membrane protein YraQ (UPF0718 family)